MKSKSLILLVLSVGFGILAAIGISQVMKSNAIGDEQPATPMGPVVLAATQINLRTQLTEDNVRIENWPTNIIPPDAVTSLEEITDMVTLAPMSQRMPIMKSAIQHKNKSTGPPIPPNMKVVAVRVSADDTIGNLLNPGDRVDVIGIFKQRDRTTNRTFTTSRTFLKALQVYSIGNKTRVDTTTSSGNGSASSIVGLLVTEKQSEALVFVQDTGSIKLVLRGDDIENDGKVGQLEEIEKIVAKKEEPKPKMGSMTIWKGNSAETTTLNGNKFNDRPSQPKSRRGDDDSQESGDMSKNNGRGDSEGSEGSDRGIDDDQYRGE